MMVNALPRGGAGDLETRGKDFSEREISRECAWILEVPSDKPKCCGKPVFAHEYCEEHYRRAYLQWRGAMQ